MPGDPLAELVVDVYSVRDFSKVSEALVAEKRGDMPTTPAVCAVLFRGTPPRNVVQALLARDPRGKPKPSY